MQIAGAGYAFDEDMGVDGLLLGKKSAESPASFTRWLEQRVYRD